MHRVSVMLVVVCAVALATAGCGSSKAGAPTGTESRTGSDRFVGSWQSADPKAPFITVDRSGQTYAATVVDAAGERLHPPAVATITGAALVFTPSGTGEVRLRLADADHLTAAGPGVRPLWQTRSLQMQRFSYGP